MWSQNSLKPSTELEANTSIYSSFLPKKGISQSELIRHLSAVYDGYIKQKLSPEEIIKQLCLLSNDLLVQLFVEIELFIKEKGITQFEKRQKGSIESYFLMLKHALSQIDDRTITEKMILELHNLSMKFTEREGMQNVYRDHDEILAIHFTDISTAGMEYLIQLIEKGTLHTMELINSDDYEQSEINLSTIHYYHLIITMIDHLNILGRMTTDKICQSLTASLDPDEPFTENMILEIFKLTGMMDLLFDKDTTPITLPELIREMRNSKNSSKLKTKKKDLEEAITTLKTENKIFSERILNVDFIQKLMAKGNYSSAELAKTFMADLAQTQSGLVLQFIHPEAVKETMDKAISGFNQAIKKATTKEELIGCVAFYIQLMLLIHPFKDHNNRVFANGLANRVFVQHGFPLAVYYNPFLFYAQAPREVTESMKLACANYAAMQASLTHKDELLDFENGINLSNEQKDFLTRVTKPLLDFITQLNSPQSTIEKKA